MAHTTIKVLEIRNYLLQTGMTDKFIRYFDSCFVNPMAELSGYTLGRFKIIDDKNRFVWLRGFGNMDERLNFLNAFYLKSETWKKYGPAANDMLINSDNCYLLKPLGTGKQLDELNEGTGKDALENCQPIAVIDFYTANGKLDKFIDLYTSQYLPFLHSLAITEISCWVSELTENKFPRLPVFHDKNLFVTISFYKTKEMYEIQTAQAEQRIPGMLKREFQETVTFQNRLILQSI